MFQINLLNIRGERPTRADLQIRSEASIGPAAGDWPWGENQRCLREEQ